jgi:hypothetical protein
MICQSLRRCSAGGRLPGSRDADVDVDASGTVVGGVVGEDVEVGGGGGWERF